MIKSFTDANVPLKNIVGFASDGCNTMMGLYEHFQREKVVITTLRNKMCETYKDLLLSFMDRDYVLHNNTARIDPTDTARTLPLNAMYLGVSVMQRLNTTQQLPPAAVTDFRM
ncbi:hypothetical protein SKAU_G00160600 [Synaphobranchus kaupii]|uniref:Uncharacterized protein n=1 Tax=Synaphobranchus kaupii TaxID=118154 RepID=A0A9Q1IZR2_SYNKA|nr:hypothetical protein SKAU_G00160600 [Synaphobranchus kaupii]